MEIKKIEDPSAVKNKKEFDPVRAIMIIVAFMIIVWIIWLGVSKLSSGVGKDLAKSGFNLASSSIPIKIEKNAPPKDSFYRNYIKIFRAIEASSESYPEKEYIEVRVVQTNLSAVDITGWKLVNSKGDSAILGKSSSLPVGGKVNTTTVTKVSGNDALIISTGHSPVGISFKLNSCTGYFEQFQDFVPPLPMVCPGSSFDKGFQSLDQDCRIFATQIPQCTTNTKPFPAGTSAGCKSFIISNISYNGCTASNKDKPDFYKPEWRIFLNRDTELWAPKDTITLLDEKGNLVDMYSY
jgi:hypothetical protein